MPGMTRMTMVTRMTRMSRMTRVTRVTKMTRVTKLFSDPFSTLFLTPFFQAYQLFIVNIFQLISSKWSMFSI